MGQRTCSIEGCGKAHDSRGYCRSHAKKFMREGILTSTRIPNETLAHRFVRLGWDVSASGCWEWRHARNEQGYGQIGTGEGTRTIGAHRASFLIHLGQIPDGYVVMHSCDNPACVNPAHLSVGTQLENVRDCIGKGRFVASRGTTARILGEDDIRAMRKRAASGERQIDLAREFGVSDSHINNIIKRRSRASVA